MERSRTRYRRGAIAGCALALAGCASGGGAGPGADGTDARAALAAVEALFAAMATRDVAAAERLVVPDGTFVVAVSEGGERRLRSSTLRDFVTNLGRGDGVLRETFTEQPRVLVEGDVAVVWGRYEFAIDGATSHTGIDALALVRTADGWKLAGGAYSVVRPPRAP